MIVRWFVHCNFGLESQNHTGHWAFRDTQTVIMTKFENRGHNALISIHAEDGVSQNVGAPGFVVGDRVKTSSKGKRKLNDLIGEVVEVKPGGKRIMLKMLTGDKDVKSSSKEFTRQNLTLITAGEWCLPQPLLHHVVSNDPDP